MIGLSSARATISGTVMTITVAVTRPALQQEVQQIQLTCAATVTPLLYMRKVEVTPTTSVSEPELWPIYVSNVARLPSSRNSRIKMTTVIDQDRQGPQSIAGPLTSTHTCQLCQQTYERLDHLNRHLDSRKFRYYAVYSFDLDAATNTRRKIGTSATLYVVSAQGASTGEIFCFDTRQPITRMRLLAE